MPAVAVADFDAVLAAARSGEDWAFRRLWDALAPPVAAYARGRGAREPDDLTSDVFLAVFDGISGFVGDEAGFRAYVFTVAHRRVVDDLRRRYRRPEPLPLTSEVDHRAVVASAENEAMDRMATVRTRDLLDRLAPAQRDVLVLRILGDLTVEQVATVLGKEPGAVKALQRRGLDTLRGTSPVRAVPLRRPAAM